MCLFMKIVYLAKVSKHKQNVFSLLNVFILLFNSYLNKNILKGSSG